MYSPWFFNMHTVYSPHTYDSFFRLSLDAPPPLFSPLLPVPWYMSRIIFLFLPRLSIFHISCMSSPLFLALIHSVSSDFHFCLAYILLLFSILLMVLVCSPTPPISHTFQSSCSLLHWNKIPYCSNNYFSLHIFFSFHSPVLLALFTLICTLRDASICI